MKKVISRYAASTVSEMREALAEIAETYDGEIEYITINSDSVRLSLVEETLTDGSKTYNVELSEVCKA